MKPALLLFDLDGTLSDPGEGITKSVQYALLKMGISEPHLKKLEGFVGPPLQVSFAERYSFSEEEVERAVSYYRERFIEKGMFENKIYDGIPDFLCSLKKEGYKLAVATSKPSVFAEEILRFFQIDRLFDFVAGSSLDGKGASKTEIILSVMNHFQGVHKEEMVMIGDRKHDIIGAVNTGIRSIGVTYGYGSKEELEEARAELIVSSVEELRGLLLRNTVKL
ncbi:HAD hydrolase-like protein [Metabacillus indicus]|uniref:HAD hydrolase-like protein n=1 Tax=Metabacillus indicus TaxID=246786 RepID=UPI00248F503D|nr:HAD hydrolase-like protein [Metabacillus indicus]